MHRRVSILLVMLIGATSTFFWLYFQNVTNVTENTNTSSNIIVIDDSIIESFLAVRQSDSWADIEADLIATDFRDLEDASGIEKLFVVRER